jgi:hypothetical protein
MLIFSSAQNNPYTLWFQPVLGVQRALSERPFRGAPWLNKLGAERSDSHVLEPVQALSVLRPLSA